MAESACQHLPVGHPNSEPLLVQNTVEEFSIKYGRSCNLFFSDFPESWAYSGFAIETHDSGEYRYVQGKLQRNRERITVRGLNGNHNHDLTPKGTSQLRPPHPLVREDWQALSCGPIAAKNAFLEDTLYGHQIYSSISLL